MKTIPGLLKASYKVRLTEDIKKQLDIKKKIYSENMHRPVSGAEVIRKSLESFFTNDSVKQVPEDIDKLLAIDTFNLEIMGQIRLYAINQGLSVEDVVKQALTEFIQFRKRQLPTLLPEDALI